MGRTDALAALIRKGRDRILEMDGKEPADISVPVKNEDLEWQLRHSTALQEALLGFTGVVHNKQPKGPMWHFVSRYQWLERPLCSLKPVEGRTVFTDAGRRSKRAVCVWQQRGKWLEHLIRGDVEDSLQTLELKAVCWAFQTWNKEPLNVVSDSLYVVGVVQRIEDALLRRTQNQRLGELFLQLWSVLKQRQHAFCIMHIRSHQCNRGLGEGNALADAAVSYAVHVPPQNSFERARNSHETFHQNARAMHRQFQIPMSDAQGIVRACPQCSHYGPGLGLGTNPKGLKALELWQMDVTHVPEFGKLKCVHVTVDTYSRFIWATAQTGEKALHVKRHLFACFAVMGVPVEIKTDNAPSYASRQVATFMQKWGVKHTTGIPHSSTGQAIVKRANRTLKEYIAKQKQGDETDVFNRLSKVLFTLNYLCLAEGKEEPAVVIHHQTVKEGRPQEFQDFTCITKTCRRVNGWGQVQCCLLVEVICVFQQVLVQSGYRADSPVCVHRKRYQAAVITTSTTTVCLEHPVINPVLMKINIVEYREIS
uniref:RNA-directed DNA polymerase n=1 Tax=Taeniopygia guttata TaxID=59729 RepID=A0A674HCR4_TAEGU